MHRTNLLIQLERIRWLRSAVGFSVSGAADNDLFDGLDIPEDPLADLDRATQALRGRTDERRYGTKMIVIEGFDGAAQMEPLTSELKSALGVGGTVKQGRIKIQDDHAARIRELLAERGYYVSG